LAIYDQTENLKTFQSTLIKIKTWNASLVEEEYNAFQKSINFSYLHHWKSIPNIFFFHYIP